MGARLGLPDEPRIAGGERIYHFEKASEASR
jgi:hypothetical protein